MRIKYFIPIFITLLLLPLMARAVDQAKIDQLVRLLLQEEGYDGWDQGYIDDQTLLEGLQQIYDMTSDGQRITMGTGQVVQLEDDMYLHRASLIAMGQTRLVEFTPTIIEALDDEPLYAAMALRYMPSEDALDALIDALDHEDMQVRDMAVHSLGLFDYYGTFEEEKVTVLLALTSRISDEDQRWILNDIHAAIVYIETGVAVNSSFEEPDPLMIEE